MTETYIHRKEARARLIVASAVYSHYADWFETRTRADLNGRAEAVAMAKLNAIERNLRDASRDLIKSYQFSSKQLMDEANAIYGKADDDVTDLRDVPKKDL